MNQFENVQDLEVWLTENGIDTTTWGVQGTKSVQNLWDELVNGDAQLQLEPPLRQVWVTEVFIQRAGHILIELEQAFGNGDTRSRRRVPSEKMYAGETCETAALRCLQEELEAPKDAITFLSPAQERAKQLKESPSYPGLQTQYIFYRIAVDVQGLPVEDFWRNNQAFAHGDPVKRHHWAWIKQADYQEG